MRGKTPTYLVLNMCFMGYTGVCASSELVHFELQDVPVFEFSRQHKYYPANHIEIFFYNEVFQDSTTVRCSSRLLPVRLDSMDVGEGLTVFLEETQRQHGVNPEKNYAQVIEQHCAMYKIQAILTRFNALNRANT